MSAVRRRGAVVDAIYVLVGGWLVTLLAWPIYQHPRALIVGAIGTLLGVGVALLGRALRLPWWGELVTAVSIYLVVAVPLAIPAAVPDRLLPGLRDAALGVVIGWKQLVTLDLPLGDYQAVLVPLLVLTLFGSFAAMRIARAGGRAIVLAPLILIAMAGVAIAFGTAEIRSSAPYRQLPTLPIIGRPAVAEALIALAVLLVLATIAWFWVRSRQERRAALARAVGVARTRVRVHRGSFGALATRGGLGVGMLVVALAVAGAVAIPALDLERTVLRDGAEPLALTAPQSSPLGAYRQWFADERFDAELFTVAAAPGVERLRLAVLDSYDGTRFTVGDAEGASRFTRLVGGAAREGAEVRVTIGDGYAAPWVPIPGDVRGAADFPVERDRALVLEDSAYYAVDGSTAVVLAPVASGEPGLSAGDVVVIRGEPVAAREAIAQASGGEPLRGVTAEAYPELTAWVAAQQPRLNGQGLLDVIDALRARGYLSHALVGADGAGWVEDLAARGGEYSFRESRSGHSVARIEALFAQLTERQRQVAGADGVVEPGSPDLVAAVGDDEQFAAAAALVAWSLGFDARVVVGVHLAETDAMRPPGGGVPAVAACEADGDAHRCFGRNAAAWIEVRVGDEWVPLDTSPQFEELPQIDREGELPPPHGTQPERPSSAVVDPPEGGPADGDAGAAPDDPTADSGGVIDPVVRIVGLIAAGLGLAMLPIAVLLGAKALRRVRRRTEDPETAIVGAWEELVDELLDHGRLVDVDGTRRQVAARIGSAQAARLAAIADQAVFAERAPSDAQRDEAWELVAAARAELRDGVPFFTRLRAALAVTSLRRRAAARPTVRPHALRARGIRLTGEVG